MDLVVVLVEAPPPPTLLKLPWVERRGYHLGLRRRATPRRRDFHAGPLVHGF